MKSVLSFLLQGLAAAAVAFTGMTMCYGEAEYATAGPVQVSVDLLMKVVPGVIGFLYPIVVKQWPNIKGLLDLGMNLLKYRSPEAASLLDHVAALEVHAQKANSDEMKAACATLREQILKSVK